MNVIPAEHAHNDIKRFRLCPGIGHTPAISNGGHCICPVCEQPLRMNSTVVPQHRAFCD